MRLQFEVSPEVYETFSELRIKSGSATGVELFKTLVKFAALSLNELDEGYTPVLQDKDGNLIKSTTYKILTWP